MTRAALFLLAALSLAACGRPAVGTECTSRDQCEPGQDCFSTPKGFCSRGCSEPGEIRECPGGSVCTVFYGNTPVCSPICKSSGECRDGFSCSAAATGSDQSACQPLAK